MHPVSLIPFQRRAYGVQLGRLFMGTMNTIPGLSVNLDVDRHGFYATARVWRRHVSLFVDFTDQGNPHG